MSRFIAGLSRGLANDYTTLAVVETFGEYQINKRYNLRHLKWLRETSYSEVVNRVLKFMNKIPSKENTSLVVDITDCGQQLIDKFIQAKLVPVVVTITENDTETRDQSSYRVLKKELITNLQFLFVSERLRANHDSPLSNIFIKELLNFRTKTKTNESQKVLKEEKHVDLVLAVALACWYGQEVGKKEVMFR